MRTISTRVSSIFLFLVLWFSVAFMDGNQAQAFLFRRGRSGKPVEEQAEKVQPKETQEKVPRRRMWQFRRERRQEEQPKQKVAEPTIESTEKQARRRWWSLRRSPRPEPEPKPQVEKPARRRWWSLRRSPRPEPEPRVDEKPVRQSEKVAKRWWRRPFGRKERESSAGPVVGVPRDLRYHMLIPDKNLERALLELFDRRRSNLEQLAMLRTFVAEKKQALNDFNKRQFDAFSMNPDVMYEYDSTNYTIYVTGSMSSDHSGAIASEERKLHLQFTKNEQIQQFVALTAGKQLVIEQLRALGLLIAEKQIDGNRIANSLETRFAIRSDCNYAYDLQTMRLMELRSAPAGEDLNRREVLIQVNPPSR